MYGTVDGLREKRKGETGVVPRRKTKVVSVVYDCQRGYTKVRGTEKSNICTARYH